MIKTENGQNRYFDRTGAEIKEGSHIRFASGRVCKVYLCADGQLGIDATNPQWIETGRAVPCEYGIYPLTAEETDETVVVHKEGDSAHRK